MFYINRSTIQWHSFGGIKGKVNFIILRFLFRSSANDLLTKVMYSQGTLLYHLFRSVRGRVIIWGGLFGDLFMLITIL